MKTPKTGTFVGFATCLLADNNFFNATAAGPNMNFSGAETAWPNCVFNAGNMTTVCLKVKHHGQLINTHVNYVT